jgi:hypothetical protein
MIAPMDIRGNFFADVATLCGKRLLAAGYTLPDSVTPSDVVLMYLNVRKRLINAKPRNVYAAPDIDVSPEHKDGFNLICHKAKEGEPLRPHQSDKLLRADCSDALLNDWGIQHLHLGLTSGSRKDGFVDGTERLLYAIATERDFYCISIMGHKDFSCKKLLEIVHKNWPQLLQNFKLNGALSGEDHSDADIHALRKSGINTNHRMPDGTVYFSPGGGITSARTSLAVMMDMQRLARRCDEMMRTTIENLQVLVDTFRKRWIFIDPPFHFQLQIIDQKAFALEKNSGRGLDLKTPLEIPPLV